jgi:hypothetical protein
MPISKKYAVHFYKNVPDDYGTDRKARQFSADLFAASEAEAIEEAKAEFCRKRGIADWSTHADLYEIAEVEYST